MFDTAQVGALLDKALELCTSEGWGAAGRAALMREALEQLGGWVEGIMIQPCHVTTSNMTFLSLEEGYD
jgi:hypothetical protein